MLKVDNLTVRAGTFRLEGASLEIPRGDCGVLMGQTGCGKTTLLEAVCGLRQVVGGKILIDGIDVTQWGPSERGIGFVPQDTSLFTAMTVRQHLAFGPTIQKWKRNEIAERVSELSERLSIAHLLDRKPIGLSGGEAKRVALGRALAPRPRILCLDEPLTGLDEETQDEILKLLQITIADFQITTLQITHSRAEAEKIGNCIFRIDDGRISLIGETGDDEHAA